MAAIDPRHAAWVVAEVPVERILPLRTRVLRPHFPADRLAEFDGDRLVTTSHFAMLDGQTVRACATFMERACPASPDLAAIQLRGMAVEPELQGQGVGTRLLEGAMFQLALSLPAETVLWCNARERAVRFYEKLGFETWGEAFDVPEIGPHRVMWRRFPLILA